MGKKRRKQGRQQKHIFNPWKHKSDAQYVHSCRRALERYQLELTPELYRHFVNLIRDYKAEPVERISNRQCTFRVMYEGRNYLVVYDNKRHTIATFLPCGAV
jgi:hypothetical protein